MAKAILRGNIISSKPLKGLLCPPRSTRDHNSERNLLEAIHGECVLCLYGGQFFSTLGQVGTQLRRQSSPIPFARGGVWQKIQPTSLEANLTYILEITPFWGPR